jgi:hypothetical protein
MVVLKVIELFAKKNLILDLKKMILLVILLENKPGQDIPNGAYGDGQASRKGFKADLSLNRHLRFARLLGFP